MMLINLCCITLLLKFIDRTTAVLKEVNSSDSNSSDNDSIFSPLSVGIEVGFHSYTYTLQSDLMDRYKKHVRPVIRQSDTVVVNVSSSLYQIVHMDQMKNLIKISAYFELSWYDAFLRWKPQDYQNLTQLYIPSHMIWIPELYLYYSVEQDGGGILIQSGLDAEVHYDGRVRYFLPFTANTLCPINVKYFPFDQQTCMLIFGAWSHTINFTRFSAINDQVNLEDFFDNQEWLLLSCDLKNHSFLYGSPSDNANPNLEQYSTVVIKIHIQRQAFYYVFNLVLPSALITVVALIGFHFPNASQGGRGSKFRLGIMTLLSMAVLLLSVVTEMPKFSSQAIEGRRGSFSSVPLIGIYYFTLLAVISLGTVTSSCFVVIERFIIKHQTPLPSWLQWMTKGGIKQTVSPTGFISTELLKHAAERSNRRESLIYKNCYSPIIAGKHTATTKRESAEVSRVSPNANSHLSRSSMMPPCPNNIPTISPRNPYSSDEKNPLTDWEAASQTVQNPDFKQRTSNNVVQKQNKWYRQPSATNFDNTTNSSIVDTMSQGGTHRNRLLKLQRSNTADSNRFNGYRYVNRTNGILNNEDNNNNNNNMQNNQVLENPTAGQQSGHSLAESAECRTLQRVLHHLSMVIDGLNRALDQVMQTGENKRASGSQCDTVESASSYETALNYEKWQVVLQRMEILGMIMYLLTIVCVLWLFLHPEWY